MSLAFSMKDTTFRCPSCGHEYFTEQQRVVFQQNSQETGSGEHNIKYREVSYSCEKCGYPLFTKTLPME